MLRQMKRALVELLTALWGSVICGLLVVATARYDWQNDRLGGVVLLAITVTALWEMTLWFYPRRRKR